MPPDTTAWSARAIRDTVAAIARGRAYRRSLTTTLSDRLLHWLGYVWRRLFAPLVQSPDLRRVTVAVLLFLALLAVVRAVFSARAAAAEREARARVRSGRGALQDFSDDARRLADAGDFTGAAHALYVALLGRLAGRGDLRLHPSKTAGDYARELSRRHSTAHPDFQAFRVRYDRVIYGSGVCSPEEYVALVRDARPLLEPAA